MPLVVIAFLVVAAAPPLEEDPSFLEGKRLYDALEPQAAAAKLEEALEATDRTLEDKARLRVWLGMTDALQGDMEAAGADFDEALRLDPKVALPDGAAPKVQDLFREAQSRALPPSTGAPPGASPPASSSSSEPVAPVVAATEDDLAPAVEPSSSAAAPAPAPSPAVAVDEGAPWLALGAAGAGASAVLALAGGVTLGLLALESETRGNDMGLTQVEAKAALDDAQLFALGANLSYGVTAVLAASAVGVGVLAVLQE